MRCQPVAADEQRFNPYHDEKGRFCSAPSKASAKSLTKSRKGVRLDSNGVAFRFPTVMLPKKEYANVMEQINRYWVDNFKDKEFCQIYFTKKTYFFENHGLDDYNIYHIEED